MYTFLAPRFLLELQCTVIFIHFYTVQGDNVPGGVLKGKWKLIMNVSTLHVMTSHRSSTRGTSVDVR